MPDERPTQKRNKPKGGSSSNNKPPPLHPSTDDQPAAPASAAASDQPPRQGSHHPPLLPFPTTIYHSMNPGYPVNGSPYPQPPAGHVPHPQYPYPIHHGHYPPPHTYHHTPYGPQYAQPGMMMYGAPPRPPSHEPASATESASASAKRKRKPDAQRKNTGDHASDDDTDAKKRTKTQRACDSCRSRKIRCDVIADADPPMCQHCKQYGFDCTFFLPITETRFKKKRQEEEAAAVAAEKEKTDQRQHTSSPRGSHPPGDSVRIYGPTSPTHLLHSAAVLSARVYESYDTRYHHSWDITQTGEGFIQIHDPPSQEEPPNPVPKPLDLRIERDVIEKLVNAYFLEVAPNLPVVTREEFLANPQPPPILLYSMCLVAAARREVPQSVFDSIRYAVNGLIKAEEVLSTASIVNVQSLLILCMLADCHSAHLPKALSGLWIRVGSAIRMAQDLGLHRAESVKQNLELRRRLWGVCVITDRWTSLAYGHPYMIDVQDCDSRLPSSGGPDDVYLDELVRLSILLGRVLKTIYSPTGLMLATDEELSGLLSDLEGWKANLPESLQFRGPEGSRTAGLLHLLYSCVTMIFWRVFMRLSYSCPAHLKFALTVERWSSLVQLAGEAIEWLDMHEQMYDVWMLVAYASTSCALVQYHTWARRKDAEAAAKLRQLRDCVRRWESSLSPDHMSARRKTAEIITLLYEATQGPAPTLEGPALNPTGSVTVHAPADGLSYKKDPTRSGGGIYVARGSARERYLDAVNAGGIVEHGEGEDDVDEEKSDGEAQPEPSSEPADGLSAMASAAAMHERAAMVNYMPLGGGAGYAKPNLNPAMDMTNQDVQVMAGMAEGSAPAASLEQVLGMAPPELIQGLPGSMFDWGQWDTFFSRFPVPHPDGPQLPGGYQAGPGAAAGGAQQQPTPDRSNSSGSPPHMRRASSSHESATYPPAGGSG